MAVITVKNDVNRQCHELRSVPSLFKETLDEFSKRGYDAASLNDIIRRANYNKGSFYYRFDGKLDLYMALIGILYQEHRNLIDDEKIAILEPSCLRTEMLIMTSSLRALGESDLQYLRLYAVIDIEPAAVSEERKKRLEAAPIDAFCDRIPISNDDAGNAAKAFVASALKNYLAYGWHAGIWMNPEEVADTLLRVINPDRQAETTLPRMKSVPAVNHSDIRSVPSSATYADSTISVVVGTSGSGKTTFIWSLAERLGQTIRTVRVVASDSAYASSWPRRKNPYAAGWNRTPAKLVVKAAGKDMSTEVLREYGLEDVADRPLDELPEEMKLRTALAAACSGTPGAILIDDVLKMLSESEFERICRLLLKCSNIGNTIIVTSSRLNEALRIADRVLFLANGKIVSETTAEELERRYGTGTVTVDYRIGTVRKRSVYDLGKVGDPSFLGLLKNHKILSISTGKTSFEDIYRIETRAMP
jgi:ABC-type multidrug transport system ATPase subunit/AcrR family transcriptional regulator